MAPREDRQVDGRKDENSQPSHFTEHEAKVSGGEAPDDHDPRLISQLLAACLKTGRHPLEVTRV